MSFHYFADGLRSAYGFSIDLVEEIDHEHFWRVQTERGEACLKRFRHHSHADTSTSASMYLHDRGFRRTPRVILTTDGQRYVRSPITDPVWWLALFEWVPGVDGKPAPDFWEWRLSPERTAAVDGEVASDLARSFAGFHEAICGFRPWPTDRGTDFWIWNIGRVKRQSELVKRRLETEDREPIRRLLAGAIENCAPHLDDAISRAEGARGLFDAVLGRAASRGEWRHCDVWMHNFLRGCDGVWIMDLDEAEPGPQIYRDLGCLGGVWDWETEITALQIYSETAPLTPEELDLYPIINNPIDGWRRLLDGYLSGDWTDEMLMNYDGNVKDFEGKCERLERKVAVLRASTAQ